MGAAGRRERARQEMREAILATARRLAATAGISALSMRAIARELGYSPAALYEYFPAKEDIYRSLFFEGAEGLAGLMSRTLAELPDGASSSDAMSALGRGYRAYAKQHPELFRLISASTIAGFQPDQAERDRSRGGFDLLVQTAARGIDDGSFAPVPPHVLAVTCWATVHGFVMLELSGLLNVDAPGCSPDDIPTATLDDLFETTLRLIAQGTLRREPLATSR